MRSNVGIKDVAHLAGVSVGTVSNVLNRPEAVSDARREKVLAAVNALGYVPNGAARQLKVGVSRVLGLLVLDTENPFYSSLARGVEEMAEQNGHGVFVANSRWKQEREALYLGIFSQQRTRGVLITPCAHDLARATALADSGTPVVLVDAAGGLGQFCTVGSDDELGGYLAVQHLLALGRRRIAVLGGPLEAHQITRRFRGAKRAVNEVPEAKIEHIDTDAMTILEGRRAGLDVAARRKSERPDAIFACNDLLAAGVLQALVMQGNVSVPHDVALIGYDDIEFCQNAVVPISSIRQPAQQMGMLAVKLIEHEIGNTSEHQHEGYVLSPELVVRTSTVG